MVELTLVFLLGAFAAGLVFLLLLPLVARRAERLVRERLERALPLDTNEILAERDRDRARFAVRCVGFEQQLEARRAEVVAAKAEVGEKLAQSARLLAEIEEGRRKQAVLAQDLAQAKDATGVVQARLDDLSATHEAMLERFAVLDAERRHAQEALAQARLSLEDERRARAEAEVHAQSARGAEAEEHARAQALRSELASVQQTLREMRHHAAPAAE